MRRFLSASKRKRWFATEFVLFVFRDLIRHYCMLVDNQGTDFWWQLSTEELIPEELRSGINIEQIDKGQVIKA
jgi:hypothetical protein